MEFTLEQRENYAGRCSDRHGSIEFEYYTRRQMRALYPSGGYAVSGEVGFVGKNPIGTAETSAGKLPVYAAGSHNPWTHSVRGYVAAEGDRFLGVVKNVLVIRVLLVLVVLAVVSVSIFAAVNWNGGQGTAPTNGLEIDPGASDWNESSLTNRGGESKGIAVPGYPSISIAANTREVQISLLNPEGNPCYFTFELVLQETGESLYTSQAVPPGQAIREVTLSRGLPAGEYPATIRITTNALDDQTPMNGANVETKLIVS
jgi:hypothetical protein